MTPIEQFALASIGFALVVLCAVTLWLIAQVRRLSAGLSETRDHLITTNGHLIRTNDRVYELMIEDAVRPLQPWQEGLP